MNRESHIVSTSDGIRVSVDVYQHAARRPSIVVCPGFFKSKDTPTFQRLCQALATDFSVVSMDFRGHGRSSGWYTFSAREGYDLSAVLEWTMSRYAQIGLLGFSLGGAIVLNTAPQYRAAVQSLAAVSAPYAFEEIECKWWTPEAWRTGLQGLERGAGCRPGSLFLKKARPIDALPALQSIPLLFVHGTRDTIVDIRHSRRLYAAAAESKRLEIIQGGGHAESLFRDDPEGFSRLIRAWFSKTLHTAPVS